MTTALYTHEQYIADVVALVRNRLNPVDQAALDGVKIVYGAGSRNVRGVTYYKAWTTATGAKVPLIEICAFAQRDRVQIAGTTIHEIGHVLAGFEAAHGKGWKEACDRAGLRKIKAAGTNYIMTMIYPELRAEIAALADPQEGDPSAQGGAGLARFKGTLGGCTAGVGSKGGASRGQGSGLRMVKMQCLTCGYVARAARSWIEKVGAVHCPEHGEMSVAQADAPTLATPAPVMPWARGECCDHHHA